MKLIDTRDGRKYDVRIEEFSTKRDDKVAYESFSQLTCGRKIRIGEVIAVCGVMAVVVFDDGDEEIINKQSLTRITNKGVKRLEQARLLRRVAKKLESALDNMKD